MTGPCPDCIGKAWRRLDWRRRAGTEWTRYERTGEQRTGEAGLDRRHGDGKGNAWNGEDCNGRSGEERKRVDRIRGDRNGTAAQEWVLLFDSAWQEKRGVAGKRWERTGRIGEAVLGLETRAQDGQARHFKRKSRELFTTARLFVKLLVNHDLPPNLSQ